MSKHNRHGNQSPVNRGLEIALVVVNTIPAIFVILAILYAAGKI